LPAAGVGFAGGFTAEEAVFPEPEPPVALPVVVGFPAGFPLAALLNNVELDLSVLRVTSAKLGTAHSASARLSVKVFIVFMVLLLFGLGYTSAITWQRVIWRKTGSSCLKMVKSVPRGTRSPGRDSPETGWAPRTTARRFRRHPVFESA